VKEAGISVSHRGGGGGSFEVHHIRWKHESEDSPENHTLLTHNNSTETELKNNVVRVRLKEFWTALHPMPHLLPPSPLLTSQSNTYRSNEIVGSTQCCVFVVGQAPKRSFAEFVAQCCL